MSDPYVGEIRMFAGNFAPIGWAFCDGSILSISDNETLFNLIGTTYGGDGQLTFALPNLQSRVPMHMGNGFTLAQTGGVEQVTLTVNQIPSHSHVPQADSGLGGQTSPGGNTWANSTTLPYSANAPNASMDPAAIGLEGGSQPHDNMIPFVVVNFIISLFGIFPTQS
jgi:microcystin-dependent protein